MIFKVPIEDLNIGNPASTLENIILFKGMQVHTALYKTHLTIQSLNSDKHIADWYFKTPTLAEKQFERINQILSYDKEVNPERFL